MAGIKGKCRILVVGSAGAGKSTLAMALASALELPVIHLDKLWWLPGWRNRSQEEFDRMLDRELAKEAWIMDGNYNRTLKARLARADCVLWLDLPRLVCVFSVLRRIAANRGRTRLDMGEGCPERLDWEFLRWVWDFPRKDGAELKKALGRCSAPQVIVLRSRGQANRLLREVRRGRL